MIYLKKLAGRKACPKVHNTEGVRVNEESSGQKPKWPKTRQFLKRVAKGATIYWFKRGLFWLWENRESIFDFF